MRKFSNEANDINRDMITVNNFFAILIKEISVTKYGSNKELIPTFSPCENCQYSDAMLKHLPADSLKKLEKTLLCSKKSVYFNSATIYRRIHNGAGTTNATAKANNAKDLNIDDRISKFQDQLKDGHVHRILLRYFTDLEKIFFSVKIDFRIKCHLD